MVSEVTSDFLDRLFDGQTMPLFQHLIHDRGLSDAEIEQLQDTLNDLKSRSRTPGSTKQEKGGGHDD